MFCCVLTLLLLQGCSSRTTSSNKPSKAHHTVDGYKNLHVEDTDKSFFDFLKMRMLGEDEWADHLALASQVPVQDIDVERIKSPGNKPLITWLGHSVFLIQYNGINVLTDPIFSDRASPLSFAGPRRYVKHAMDYADLPDIDIVVISHNHYDHLDEDSLQTLARRSLSQANPIQFYVPMGLVDILLDQNIQRANIVEMDWWDSHTQGNVVITAQPSQHWSARGLADRLNTLWASFHLKIEDFNVWFAGDTGYNDVQFKQIGQRSTIDLALIPIGAYAPRWFMQKYHVNPAEAVMIHKDVKAKKSIGMHWGTFPLTAEEPGEPVTLLEQEKQAHTLNQDSFITLAIGESIQIELADKN